MEMKVWDGIVMMLLGKNNTIASLSFGAERKFSFKHKQTKQTVSLVLEHGSLLIMKDATQSNWLHSLPKSKKHIPTQNKPNFSNYT
jgi:alkylated DNA repair dioxygenase AlkB